LYPLHKLSNAELLLLSLSFIGMSAGLIRGADKDKLCHSYVLEYMTKDRHIEVHHICLGGLSSSHFNVASFVSLCTSALLQHWQWSTQYLCLYRARNCGCFATTLSGTSRIFFPYLADPSFQMLDL